MSPKNKGCFSPISTYWFIRTIAQVQKSGIHLTFTVDMVPKLAAKIGFKWESNIFWNKVETFDRVINIKHKRIPKDILTDNVDYQDTHRIKKDFFI